MTSSKERRDRGNGTCVDAIRMRLRRARRVRGEMAAQGAGVQLFAIFAALAGSTPVLPTPRVSAAEPSEEPASSEGRVTSYRPPLTVDMAMRNIRSARQMTPRVKSSIEVLKRLAPSASEWIDYKARWLEWSEVTRCLVPGDELATSLRLAAQASAWQSQRTVAKEFKHEPKADDELMFRP